VKLSDHFDLGEFEYTSTGLPNFVPAGLALKLRDLCHKVLEPVRARFGAVTIRSGYRSVAVNRAVGGAETSQHIRGEAADFEVAGCPNLEVAAWVRDNLRFDQLILEAYRADDGARGWIHVSWTVTRAPRQSVLTMSLGPHGPIYTPGLPDAETSA
jgi:zinc D-Ala-D-Ala carboxypeptidase